MERPRPIEAIKGLLGIESGRTPGTKLWREFFAREDLERYKEGFMETQHGNTLTRGPVSDIYISEDGLVCIDRKWVEQSVNGGDWERRKPYRWGSPERFCGYRESSDGRIRISASYNNENCLLYPEGVETGTSAINAYRPPIEGNIAA